MKNTRIPKFQAAICAPRREKMALRMKEYGIRFAARIDIGVASGIRCHGSEFHLVVRAGKPNGVCGMRNVFLGYSGEEQPSRRMLAAGSYCRLACSAERNGLDI